MKVAVTGANGFIGRHVLQTLAAESDVQVCAVTRHVEPSHGWPQRIQHVTMDIAAPAAIDGWDRIGRPDVLIHLAWSGLPAYRSRHHFEVHLGEQYDFLKSLVQGGLPALVCAGTCFEYGNCAGELDESMATDPTNAYAFAKDGLRRQLGFLREEHPFQLVWPRLFYTYGAGQPANTLYGHYRRALARGDRVFPMSPGDQLRDYMPVAEVSRLLVGLALRAPDAGIVNVCSGSPITVADLVRGWLRTDGAEMELQLGQLGYAPHEPMAFWGSTTKLRTLLPPR